MDISSDEALLRVLVLMAKADGVIAPEEQTMLQRICEEHFEGSHSHAWRDVASSAIDLKTAATAIPISERQSTLELAIYSFQPAWTNRVSRSTLLSFTPSTPWSITSTSRKIKKSVL